MSVPLCELFPQCSEYLVRFGWMPGGKEIWVQLLDRQQQHLILAVVHISCFVSVSSEESSSIGSQVYILWEERSSIWISVSSCA